MSENSPGGVSCQRARVNLYSRSIRTASASIGNRGLEQFAGEISAVSEAAQPEAIHAVYCDAAVQCTQEFRPSEPVQLEPKGGGGTAPPCGSRHRGS